MLTIFQFDIKMSGSESLAGSLHQLHSEHRSSKSVCIAAVVGLLYALASLSCLLFSDFLFVPLIGMVVSLYAVNKIHNSRDELAGMGMAKVAVLLNAAVFASVWGYHSYIYATEVPAGYRRISFADLQPGPGKREAIPQAALELDGQKVFIKGYIHPGQRRTNLKTFVLVPDLGTCCFGGQPALTDMIEVTLDDRLLTHHSRRCRALTGVLEVDDQVESTGGLGGLYYRLKADGIR